MNLATVLILTHTHRHTHTKKYIIHITPKPMSSEIDHQMIIHLHNTLHSHDNASVDVTVLSVQEQNPW